MIKGGGLPTGTLQTVIQGVLQARNAAVSMLTFGLLGGPTKEEIAARKRQKEQLRRRGNSIDRAAEKKREGLVSRSAASKASTDVTRNFLSPLGAYSAQAGGQLSLPHFMTTVNTPIVHTTAEALGYPKSFEYRERIPVNFLSLLGTGLALVLTPIALAVVIPTILVFPDSVAALATKIRAADLGGNAARIRASLNDNFSSTGSMNVVAIASSASGAKTARVSMHSGYEPGLGASLPCSLSLSPSLISHLLFSPTSLSLSLSQGTPLSVQWQWAWRSCVERQTEIGRKDFRQRWAHLVPKDCARHRRRQGLSLRWSS